MTDAVVSFVLDQLSTLVREESALLGGLRDEVQLIRDELGQMKGFLRVAEAIVENNPDLEAWVGQVRDVSYEAEDVLDDFILRFGRHHYDDGFLGRVQKVYGSIKNSKARHQLATKIQSIKNRIKNIFEAHQRLQNPFPGSSSAFLQNQNQITVYDSRRDDALFVEDTDLVGIERPKQHLMDMLFTGDPQLRVVSVIGMGGLGKTTLVKKVYDDPNVKKRFKHHAWITVSQSFTIGTLLKQMIEQLFKELNKPAPDELDRMDTNDMKRLVRDFLHQENYILVFDDVWTTTGWDSIRMTFPKNNSFSCIMITSRNIDVGRAATSDIGGNFYRLKPLIEEESWNLFCKKAFRDTSCPDNLRKVTKDIIERCDGLPLAIVVIAGVLARKSRRTEEWDLFNRSLGEQLAREDQLEKMTNIISLSCQDLPDNLKICFLYLSILPEDASIRKMRLIRLWIAEGFVQKKEGMTIEEVAESYLLDLINRSLIQVDDTYPDGRLKTCRVHDIIHQIILRKAREHGITTIVSEQGMEFPAKIRRLVIHNSAANLEVNDDLIKCLRSLICLESINSMYRSFQSEMLSNDLRLLEVLDLEGAPLEIISIEIFKKFHLRYLSLKKTKVKSVPRLIGKLQKLETLDLRYTKVTKLPDEIVNLQQLRHLLMGDSFSGVEVPHKIGTLRSLQSLGYINANESGIVKEIGELTQLRKLKMKITELRVEHGKELCKTLEKLNNLRSLFVYYTNEEEKAIDLEYSISSTPQFLRDLKFWGRLEKAPLWIQSLQGLTSMELRLSQLRDDPLQLVQDLPNLVDLILIEAYQGEGLCFKAGGFQKLTVLILGWMPELRWVEVEKGAMPFLKRLFVDGCKSMENLPVGIQHLTSLKYLRFTHMSNKFANFLRDMDKQGVEYKKIAHVPQVEVEYFADGVLMTLPVVKGREMPNSNLLSFSNLF